MASAIEPEPQCWCMSSRRFSRSSNTFFSWPSFRSDSARKTKSTVRSDSATLVSPPVRCVSVLHSSVGGLDFLDGDVLFGTEEAGAHVSGLAKGEPSVLEDRSEERRVGKEC